MDSSKTTFEDSLAVVSRLRQVWKLYHQITRDSARVATLASNQSGAAGPVSRDLFKRQPPGRGKWTCIGTIHVFKIEAPKNATGESGIVPSRDP